jgi:hypothetical protein
MRFLTAIAFASGALLLSSCATPPTEGNRVMLVPMDSAMLQKCEILGPVRAKANNFMKWDRYESKKEVQHRLRDAAATQYPTSDTVGEPNVVYNTPGQAAITSIAYKCFKAQ